MTLRRKRGCCRSSFPICPAPPPADTRWLRSPRDSTSAVHLVSKKQAGLRDLCLKQDSFCKPSNLSLTGIVVSPSDGASSDSCLKSSSNPNPTLSNAIGDLSTLLISGPGALAPAGTPLTLSSNLLLQNQGSMLAASFQEGRRASDTSLTQGKLLIKLSLILLMILNT